MWSRLESGAVNPEWTRERCEALDRADPLASLRECFDMPDGLVYLDGNSLGALPRAVAARLAHLVAEEWGNGLVGSWASWMSAPERVGDKLARLIGARTGEVVVADTTTIALTKLLGAALGARPGRHVVVTTPGNFPSDLYAAEGIGRLLGGSEVRYVEADPEAVAGALDESVAVLMLTHVDFRTGALFDMAALTRAAHDAGALTLWDLCHSAGAVVVDCDADGVDLAVGCSYKYLNGGPGAPAFLYVRRELQESLENPLPGWLGHAAPFEFTTPFRAAAGVRRFVTSTPPVLAMAALDAALDAFDGVSMRDVRAKSLALGELFIAGVLERLGDELVLASPRQGARRGSQVSFRHARAYEIVQALITEGVVGDFRAPDLCRFGFAPAYLRYCDVFTAVETLAAVVTSGAHEAPAYSVRKAVT